MRNEIRNIILIAFLLPCIVFISDAQNNSFGIKDETYNYYRKCLRQIDDSSVLRMIDTLFLMSEKDSDKRMQAVALSTRMDYFYHKKMRDSLEANVERTKEFAKKVDISTYYYFAWARLITFYINEDLFQTAFLEIEKMQKEALDEDDGTAMMQSYQMMGRLYNAWEDNEESARYFLKAIQTVLDYDLDKQTLAHIYTVLSLQYLNSRDFEEAEKAIVEAEKYVFKPTDKWHIETAYARLYTNWGKLDEAAKHFDMAEKTKPMSSVDYFRFRESKMEYYRARKDYEKSLAICKELLEEDISVNDYSRLLYSKARSLEKLGYFKEALKDYKTHHHLKDSLLKDRFTKELSEKTILFELNEVNAEKQKIEIRLKTRWLTFSVIVVVILSSVLFVAIMRFYKIRSLSVKLKKSEQIKTAFLQNLSHEVRTPLNAVMGFAEVISSSPSLSMKEMKEYTDIIFDNSKMLIKIFDDAIEASDVQTSREKRIVAINDLCKEILFMSKDKCAKEVELVFVPCEGRAEEVIDKSGVVKVLTNIIFNAAKFTKKGSITLKTEYLSKDKFQISVTDTGPGIPPEMAEKVFESFYKINEMSQGVGLGLPLSRMFAESMNGTLSIDTSYTKGCRVVFIFPV